MTPTRPGQYRYTDPIGGPPQLVDVRVCDGELVAVFPGEDGDEACDILVADMSGDFEAV